MFFWSANDFVKCNKKWGNFRRLVGKIQIFDTHGFIGLFRENDDGRLSISVHDDRNNYAITKLGMYWANTEREMQYALDEIYLKLMEG